MVFSMAHTLFTSSGFASAYATGEDWRDIGRKILESLESIRTPDDGMNIGFLYASDPLGGDVASLLSLLKNVTRIKAWYGATGAGICANGQSVAGQPAAVAMIGRLPEGSFHELVIPPDFTGTLDDDTQSWMQKNPMAVLSVMHGLLCPPAADALDVLRETNGIFSAGGFASGRQGGIHIAGGNVVSDRYISGFLLGNSENLLVSAAQGTVRAGSTSVVTGCRGNMITSIDDKPAFDALRAAIEQIQLPPVLTHDEGDDTSEADAEKIKAAQPERRGHIHAAFGVKGTDTGAVLVRNITQADEESKTLSVAHPVYRGQSIQFVYRDMHTALDGLAANFQTLRDRAILAHPQGRFEPKALLHFGCGARLQDVMTGEMADEAAIAQRIFGKIPMCGFYTAAEICNGHVYGYTGLSILII